ncbi:hypothetical protein HB364_12565 [Pseudoflavitalea sp. X16]|nr:hypothetical protein [Paraflavitalea devenefica]
MIHLNYKLLFTAAMISLFAIGFISPVYAQGRIWFTELGVDIRQEQKIQYTGGELQKSPAYGFLFNIHNGGKRMAIGFQVDYSSVNLEKTQLTTVPKKAVSLWEMYAVLRYYPLLPTLRLGKQGAIRFTAGGMIGGYDFYWKQTEAYMNGTTQKWSPLQFSSALFAGICFSSFRNTTGLSVKLNYKPQTYTLNGFELANFTLRQPYSLGAALLIGPRIKSK